MSYEEALTTVTRVAGADLSAAQYTFVKYDTNGEVVQCNAAGEQADGVLQNEPAQGEEAEVAIAGITKVEAGAATSVADAITTAADGQAQTAATGHVILGTGLEAATGAGTIIAVDFRTHMGTA